VVFGGIYGGLFTPTEGAGIGAAGTFVTAAAKRELDLSAFHRAFLGTAQTTAMVFMIFLGADMLNSALALSQMPPKLAQAVAGLTLPPVLVVAGILVFYIVLCSVMDELSLVILTVPVLIPVVMSLDLYGLSPTEKAIWFGILVLSVVEIGLIAPPVGLNVYVVNSLARDVPMAETYRGRPALPRLRRRAHHAADRVPGPVALGGPADRLISPASYPRGAAAAAWLRTSSHGPGKRPFLPSPENGLSCCHWLRGDS
jgi:TRAP-type C4-dicarboxylate transport system permease large subunit